MGGSTCFDTGLGGVKLRYRSLEFERVDDADDDEELVLRHSAAFDFVILAGWAGWCSMWLGAYVARTSYFVPAFLRV